MNISARWLVDASGRAGTLGKLLGFGAEFHSPPLTAWTAAVSAPARSVGTQCPRFTPRLDGWTWRTESVRDDETWTWLARTGAPPPAPPTSGSAPDVRVARIVARPVRWRIFRPLAAPGVALAGDAAAVLDPACGQGVLNALYSGVMAGHAIVQSAYDPAGEAWYLAGYDQWVIERFLTQATALRQFYSELGIDLIKPTGATERNIRRAPS